jgi:hypothetical protein
VNDAGREALRALVQVRYDGFAARAARDFGVTRVTVTDYLNGKGGESGAGAKLIAGVQSVDMLTALIMLSGTPRLRAPAWLAVVAKSLEADGHGRDVIAWALLQSIQIGCTTDEAEMRRSAKALIALRSALCAED